MRVASAFLLATAWALADTSPPAATFTPTTAGLSRSFDAHRSAVRAIAFSADGRTFATLSLDRSIKLWATHSDNLLRTVSGTFGVERMWLSPDGKRVIAQEAQNIVVVDATKDERIATINGVIARGFSVSPDGKRVIATTRAARVAIYSTQTGEELMQLEGANRGAGQFAWSPDGKRLVEMGADRVGRIWDAEKGEQIATLDGATVAATSLAFAPDGKSVAIAAVEGTIRFYDAATGKEKLTVDVRTARPQSLAWSRDGAVMATGHYDGSIRLWDPKTGKELRRLDTQGGAVWSLAFTPDGRSLVSGTNDGKVSVWGRARVVVPPPAPPRSGKPGFLGVTAEMDPDGEAGVKLSNIVPGSAAERAGLKQGDVIISAGGKNVNDFEELRSVLTNQKEGDEIEIKYKRDGAETTIKVKLGGRPEE